MLERDFETLSTTRGISLNNLALVNAYFTLEAHLFQVLEIDQYIQEVEEERFDTYNEDEDEEDEDLYNAEEDERYQEYRYRYGDAEDKY